MAMSWHPWPASTCRTPRAPPPPGTEAELDLQADRAAPAPGARGFRDAFRTAPQRWQAAGDGAAPEETVKARAGAAAAARTARRGRLGQP